MSSDLHNTKTNDKYNSRNKMLHVPGYVVSSFAEMASITTMGNGDDCFVTATNKMYRYNGGWKLIGPLDFSDLTGSIALSQLGSVVGWQTLLSPTLTSGAASVTLVSGAGGVASWSSYKDLLIRVMVRNPSGNPFVYLRLGSGSIDSGNNYSSAGQGRDSGANSLTANQETAAQMGLTVGPLSNADAKFVNQFEIVIYDVNNSSFYKNMMSLFSYVKTGSHVVTGTSAGMYLVASAIDQFQIAGDTGTMDFVVGVYGRK